MLTKRKVTEVLDMLTSGRFSQREIARRAGVSRGTVNALSTGKRGSFGQDELPEELPVFVCEGCNREVVGRCVECDAIGYLKRRGLAPETSVLASDAPPAGDPTPEQIKQRAAEMRKGRMPAESGARPVDMREYVITEICHGVLEPPVETEW